MASNAQSTAMAASSRPAVGVAKAGTACNDLHDICRPIDDARRTKSVERAVSNLTSARPSDEVTNLEVAVQRLRLGAVALQALADADIITKPENAQAKVSQKETKHTPSTTPEVRWSRLIVQELSEGYKSMPKLGVNPLLPSPVPTSSVPTTTAPARRRVARATLTVALPVEGDSQHARVATVAMRRFAEELVRSGLLAKEPLKGAYHWHGGKGNRPQMLVATLTLTENTHLLALLTGDNADQRPLKAK